MDEYGRRAASPNPGPGLLPDLPLYETDLLIPKYRDGKWGEWEIRTVNLILDHGYHTGVWLVQDLQVLTKQSKDKDTLPGAWMSLCPHEIESQELGCRHAFGHTVIMGLGLGWCTVNTAMNPSVEKVTVVELDPVVIRLVDEVKVLEQAPEEARKKIRILEANAMEWLPDEPVDFLYAGYLAIPGRSRNPEPGPGRCRPISAQTKFISGARSCSSIPGRKDNGEKSLKWTTISLKNVLTKSSDCPCPRRRTRISAQ